MDIKQEIKAFLDQKEIRESIRNNEPLEDIYKEFSGFRFNQHRVDASEYLTAYLKELGIDPLEYFETRIPTGAFAYDTSMEGLPTFKVASVFVLPDKIEKIDVGAFENQPDLSIFSVSETTALSRINSFAFNSCTNLRHFVFPETLTAIGSYVFSRCTNLKHLFFKGPSPIAALDPKCIDNKNNIEVITIEPNCVEAILNLIVVSNVFKKLESLIYNGTREDFTKECELIKVSEDSIFHFVPSLKTLSFTKSNEVAVRGDN